MQLQPNDAELFDIYREILVLYTEYERLEPRTLSLVQEKLRDFRLDGGIAIVVSLDPNASAMASRRRGEATFVMMQGRELDDPNIELRGVIARVLTTTDHFDVTYPIQDAAGFYGRRVELDLLRQALDRGQSVGVFGLRKAGKTSLLNSIAHERITLGRPIVRIDLSEVASADDLRLKLITRTWSALFESGELSAPKLRLLTAEGQVRFDLPSVTLHWLDDLRRMLHVAEARVELFVDEIDQSFPPRSSLPAEEANGLFQVMVQLRGLLQDSLSPRLVLLCAGVDPALFETPLVDGRDNLIYKLVRLVWLSPMPRDEMAEMVRGLGRRMGVRIRDHAAIDLLFREYGGHPLLSRKACSVAARGRSMDEIPFEISVDRLDAAVRARGEGSPQQQAQDVWASFRQWFPDEADLVRLWNSETGDDRDIAAAMLGDDSNAASHAVEYGICYEDLSPRIRAAFPTSE